jgi:formylglycine-generating enzyme required for sulfatase activity
LRASLRLVLMAGVVGLGGCQAPPSDSAKPPASSQQATNSQQATSPRAPAQKALPAPAIRFNASAWQLPDDDRLGFAEVPAGTFTMGSDKGKDRNALDNELPSNKVALGAFFIGRYEVTVAQYKACAGDGGCRPGDPNALKGRDDLPVRYISWHEALAYCTWLEKKLTSWSGPATPVTDALSGHRGGRWRVTLPSEAEWERSARGDDGRIYPWGDGIDQAKANYTEANFDDPTPVGAFAPGASPFGVQDLSGNVSEWTRTQFRPYPYRSDDGRDQPDAPDTVPRVVRGGSFQNVETNVRATSRFRDVPNGRSDFIGFRVAVSSF